MPCKSNTLLLATCLLATAVSTATYAGTTDFTSFGEDEDVCRQVGAAAIQGASGPTAAERYDVAHGQCMAAHFRMRQMDAYGNATPPYPAGGPGSFGFPDAYYHIPYATPGYGYDGFSY